MINKPELLIKAALENNLEKIKAFVEQDQLPLDDAFDDQDNTPLHIATKRGYLHLVKYIVKKNPQLILKANKEGNYPIHYAVENGYAEITRAILQADKMSINLLDKNNNTPLDIAIEKEDGQMITKIIEICPELLEKEDSEGNIPLRRAINKAKAVSVRVILEANPKAIFPKNKNKSASLTSISQKERQDAGLEKLNITDIEKTETITLILETHPQILQVRYEDGRTFAHTVVTSQNTARRKLAIEIFTKYPEARLQQDNQGDTPLHIAIQHNNIQIAKTILAQGIDILNVFNKAGRNALHLATELRNYEIVKSILEIARPDVIKKGTNSPESLNCLHIAAKIGYDDLIELILSKDQSLIETQTSTTKSTALHLAAFHGRIEVIKAILKTNPNAVKLKDKDNLNPLDIAINKSHLDVVEYLILHHQDKEFIKNALKQKNKLDGLTILHIAVVKGHTDLVGIILKIDKDLIQETDALGLTPLDLAIKEDNLRAIKFILKYHAEAALALNYSGAHSAIMFNKPKALKIILGSYPQTQDSALKIKDASGWTFLHHAAAQGHLAIVKHLVKEKAKIDDMNMQQDSPLHLAARGGHKDVVRYLCSMGADINLKNQDGKTPIYEAVANGHSEVVQNILKEILENDPSFISNASRDLLAKAMESGYLEVVESILESILKSCPLFIGYFGGELLAKAIENGKTEMVYYLIAHKNIIHLKAMHLAIKSGHLNVIELLEECGYEIDLTNLNGYTTAHLAAENGKLNVLTYLAAKDPDIIKVKDNNHNSLLHSAAVSEDLKTIQYLVKQGLDITSPNLKGFTALHLASIFGRTNIVQYLIQQAGFAGNLDVKDNQGDTPLGLAVKNAHLKVVKLLLKQGANLSTKNNAGNTLTHLAVSSNSIELLSYLFDQGLKLDAPSTDGLLPLHQAAIEGKTKIIQFFYKKGLNINQIDDEGLTPFDLAVENGQLELVKWYLKEFHDLNISGYNHHSQSLQKQDSGGLIQPSPNKKGDNSMQNTPLHLAAQKGYLHAVKLLIEHGSVINTFNRDKDTPLHLAVQNGHTVVVQDLLSKEANTQLRNKAGKIPLDLAQGKQEIVDLLITPNTPAQKAETDDSQTSSQQQIKETSSISHKTKKNKVQKSVQSLIDKEIELQTKSKDTTDAKHSKQGICNTLHSQDNTSLHLAAIKGNTEKLKQLLSVFDTRSQINAQNKDGFTALHLAVQNSHLGAAQLLLEHGAENIQNRKGNSPLHFAAKSGDLEITTLLIHKGAEVNTTNKSGNSPLHLASHKGHLELVSLFLQNGAQINCLNNNDNSPLHLATQNGHLKVVKLFLENSIDTKASNKDSKTALDLAIEKGHQEVIEILQNSIETSSKKTNKQEILESKDTFLNDIKPEITPIFPEAQTSSTSSQVNTQRLFTQMTRRNAIKKESALDLFRQGIDLHHAAKVGYLWAIDTILKAGADINALNIEGQTPLHLAIFYDQYHSAQKLLKNGAKVEALYPHGFNLLHLAIHLDKSKYFIKMLSDYTTDIEARDIIGNTAGHVSAAKGRGDILSLLLYKKANMNAKNNLGDTWLHVAMIYGHKNIVNLLLDKGSDIQALNAQGQTPLSLAISYNKMEMAIALIRKGAKAELIDLYKAMDFCMPETFIKSLIDTLDNVNIKGKDGYTPGHFAALYGLQNVLEYLLNKGANVYSLNDFGHTWLHMASAGGQINTIQFLLTKGTKENCKDFAGNTPLHYAKTGETVKLLIQNGADYSVCNRNKLTPLDKAILSASPEVIVELIKYTPQNSENYPNSEPFYVTQDRASIISKSKEIAQKNKADSTTKSVAQFIQSHETPLKSVGVTSDEAHQPIDKVYGRIEEVKSLGEDLDINI